MIINLLANFNLFIFSIFYYKKLSSDLSRVNAEHILFEFVWALEHSLIMVSKFALLNQL